MKRLFCLTAAVLVWTTPLPTQPAPEVDADTNRVSALARTTPGLAAAQAISTITGVAISPLLGVSAVGAWEYFKNAKAAPEQRRRVPWFAQPWFWIPGLVLVGLVFLKDTLGKAMPTALKKPMDVLEASDPVAKAAGTKEDPYQNPEHAAVHIMVPKHRPHPLA